MFDVAIIGAGIIGTAITRKLAQYNLQLILIEKDSDLANGTTKANSAIVHAGFDPKPGTLKAKFNVAGNRMFEALCRDLDVTFKQNGSLVIAFSEEEMLTLNDLAERGGDLGVPDLEVVGKEKLQDLEPGLSKEARGALYAPTAGVTDPYLLAIALAESAANSGAEIRCNRAVTDIVKTGEKFILNCGSEEIEARYVINAAGLYSDQINAMVNPAYFQIQPTRGEYFLLDKSAGHFARHVLFPCPTELGKGVLISPTAHGNLIVGPNAETVDNKEATETTAQGLSFIRENAEKIKSGLPLHKVITSFSGLRAKTSVGDFIIEENSHTPGFINLAGIESPGLVSAPAIAEYVADLLTEKTGPLEKNHHYCPTAKSHNAFINLSEQEKTALIKEDPRFGRIICRCESVTEGEIVRAIKGPVGARTLDGIKKRTRPGGGRCQGGFCGPKVIQILARELNLDPEDITKNNPGSYILAGPTKKKQSRVKRSSAAKETSPAESQKLKKAQAEKDHYDLVIIGGGPAGMAAAVAAREKGIDDILVIERDHELGGILQQCIHNGFGLHQFREELTGPEYAERFIDQLEDKKISCKLNTMVLSVSQDRRITFINNQDGWRAVQAGAIVLAMGCRERTRGAINIPGTRPAGIFSAGSAQRFVNIEGYMVGRRVVVFGSGDIGLIMARRIVWEGGEVVAVIERKPYSEGLVRNYVQCVEDYNIPMFLEHTITDIKGKDRVESITIANTDQNKQPIGGTERELKCDTILFSRGLIPENELSMSAGVTLDPATGGPVVNEAMETSVEGIFACGNVVHVHDLVDWVTEESYKAGRGAADYIMRYGKGPEEGFSFQTTPGKGINYIVPQQIRTALMDNGVELYMRCDGHHENSALIAKASGKTVKNMKKNFLTPGEMIVIKIKAEDLPSESFKELTVELDKGDT